MARCACLLCFVLAGCAQAPAGEVRFALMGDTPYNAAEVDQPLAGWRRIEPWGSPQVSWLNAVLTANELQVGVARRTY